MRGRNRIVLGVIGVLTAVGLLLSTGCATRDYRKDDASQLITQGEKAVYEAKSANASTSAQAELKAAEEKLSEARNSFDQGLYDQAGRLAKEGAVAADHARAKATTDKSRKDAEEVRKNLEALRQEIERQSQSK